MPKKDVFDSQPGPLSNQELLALFQQTTGLDAERLSAISQDDVLNAIRAAASAQRQRCAQEVAAIREQLRAFEGAEHASRSEGVRWLSLVEEQLRTGQGEPLSG